MHNHSFPLLIALFAAAVFAGCQVSEEGPAESVAGIPLLPQELLTGPDETTKAADPPEAQRTGPLLRIRARFISFPAALAGEILPVKADVPLAVVPLSRGLEILKQSREHPDVRMLTAPRLTLYSGQRAYVSVAGSEVFVHDVVYKGDGDAGGTFEDVIDQVPTGFVLDVGARADGDSVVLTHLAPRTVQLLGFRECKARVTEAGRAREIRWQEAILLNGTCPVENPCEIRLGPDRVLVVMFNYKVSQTAANARLYASGGRVREKLLSSAGGGFAADASRRMVVMVYARVLPPADQ